MPMPDERLTIVNADIVTPTGVINKGHVTIHNDIITEVGTADTHVTPSEHVIDATGFILMPGIIDLHGDAIEKVISPRPGGSFDIRMGILEMDKQLISTGVTTMYHCLVFGEATDKDLRHYERARTIAQTISEMQDDLLARTRVHARYEVTDHEPLATLSDMISNSLIDILSFMDHTPGQGQFKCVEDFKTYYGDAYHLNDDELEALIEQRLSQKDDNKARINQLAEQCLHAGVTMASHDDDTPEKVQWAHSLGVHISEFPVAIEAAKTATELGMHVLMGAPNVLRGKSLTKNLSGRQAIKENACQILGSDYAPHSMLHAAFALRDQENLPLHEAIRHVTTEPAKAVGLENCLGTIQPEAKADLLLVEAPLGEIPRLHKVIMGGREVFSISTPSSRWAPLSRLNKSTT